MDIGFIGVTVGTASAVRLSERGHRVVAVATPDEVAAAAELVFITTPLVTQPMVDYLTGRGKI